MNRGKQVDRHGQYAVLQWTGPQVDSGEMLPFSSQLVGGFTDKRHATLEEAQAHIRQAPKLRVARVEFEVYIPVDATDDQIEEWIEFELHANGSLHRSNPLERHSLEARDVWIDVR